MDIVMMVFALGVSLVSGSMGAAQEQQRCLLMPLFTLVHVAFPLLFILSFLSIPLDSFLPSPPVLLFLLSLQLYFPSMPGMTFSPWAILLHPSRPGTVISICGKHFLILADAETHSPLTSHSALFIPLWLYYLMGAFSVCCLRPEASYSSPPPLRYTKGLL